MTLNNIFALPESEPALCSDVNQAASNDQFANLAMEEDISMSFPTNSFDASADFHALNDQIWISNNDLGNLVPDAFNLSIGPSSSSVLRHNFLDFFDELNLNTAPMPLSNPGGGNIEPIVTLDNSEIKALSYPNNLYIPSTMDF